MNKQRTWKRWNEEDRATLKELAGKLSTEEIALTMGRSMQSVRMEAEKLGISLRCKKCDRHGIEWTKQEEFFLELKAGEMSSHMIAKVLGRSVYSVQSKAKRMGISLILENDNWPAETLAKFLGLNPPTLLWWIRKGQLKAFQYRKNALYSISRENFREFYNQYGQKCPSLKNVNPENLEFVLNG